MPRTKPTARDELAELFDYLLRHDLANACGIGQFADDRRSPFNNLSKPELRMMLNENNIAYPDYNEDKARVIARYVIEREHYRRAGNTERVSRITQRMEESMRFNGVKYFAGDSDAMEATADAQVQAGTDEKPPTTKEEPMSTTKAAKPTKKKSAKTAKATPTPKPASKAPKKAARAKATRSAVQSAPRKATKTPRKLSQGKPKGKRPRRVADGERVRAPKMLTGKIVFKTKTNPFRPGTKLAETFDLMRKTGTVEDYRKACQRSPKKYHLQYLWLVRDKGHIKIES